MSTPNIPPQTIVTAASKPDIDTLIDKLLRNPQHNGAASLASSGGVGGGGGAGGGFRLGGAAKAATSSAGDLTGIGATANAPVPPLMTENEIKFLVLESRAIFMSQPMLVEVLAPIRICGDVHGQYNDLLRLFDLAGFPPQQNYIFLGDYVDRGRQSLETILLLMAYKVKFPNNFFLLRGNHECSSINRIYGFYDECKRRYSVKIWKLFTDTFNCMPVAGLVESRILCMHGGISPELRTFDSIHKILRPTDVPDSGLICDLLWADPNDESDGWGQNDRGVSWTFGPDIVEAFTAKHDIDLICRAHQVVDEGYQFFSQRRCVTVFSAPNYCGDFDNSGAVMCVDGELRCSFLQLRPQYGGVGFN